MNTIYLQPYQQIPSDFTGLAVWSDHSMVWYVEGGLHSISGSTTQWSNGCKCWFKNGNIHRLDGPAIMYPDGNKLWFIDGEPLSFQQFWARQKDTEHAPRIIAYMLGAKQGEHNG